MQKQFVEIFEQHIKRDGAPALLAWLEKAGFYKDPASTKFHGAHEGGLLEHSLNVYCRLVQLVNTVLPEEKRPSEETIAIVALLHDVCKTNGFYKVEMRNKKNEQTGAWEKVPAYFIDDTLPYGHGEKSVYIISGFMKLSREEALAIRFHMGAFAPEVKGGDNSVSKAFELYPLALLLHEADMLASYLDEAR